MQAIHLVCADGRVFAADEALPHICLGLRRWRWLARALAMPPARWVSPSVYRFIAKRRRMFSVLVAGKVPESCPR
jgi:predicted DCC family thiol-disulfide oxidoreductase YuxK